MACHEDAILSTTVPLILNDMSSPIVEIDIESIVRKRVGKNAKYIPRFVYSGLRRLIHEDFINGYLREGREGIDFCQGVLDYLKVTVDVKGFENLPDAGNGYFTFVSNHPLGAIDGVTLGAVLGKKYDGKIRYLVNDFLMNLRGLAPLCVPVNKIGSQARNLPMQVEEIFLGENHVIMFPAGLCSRRTNGVICDLDWQKTFVVKSRKHQRDVVPVHFIGQNSNRFYRVANFCKTFHLPNLAMALLPDEMYRSQGGHYEVRIGKPIPWQTFTKEKTAIEWANYVKERVYQL